MGCIVGRVCSPGSVVRSLAVAVTRPFNTLAGEVGTERAVLCVVVCVGCDASEVGLLRLVGRREVCLDGFVLPCATAISGESCLFTLPDEVDTDRPG